MTSTGEAFAARVRADILKMVERVPVSILPGEEMTFSLVDNGTADRAGTQRAEARFREGRWRRPGGGVLPFEPTHWLRLKAQADG